MEEAIERAVDRGILLLVVSRHRGMWLQYGPRAPKMPGMVIPRSVGYLLVGIGVLLLAKWALAYLVPPTFFRPGAPQVVLVVAALAVIVALRFHRVR